MKASRAFAVYVDDAVCDGCAICIFFCKPAVFTLSKVLGTRGVYPATVAQAEGCTGCGLCELGCPQLAIRVVEVSDDARAQ